MSMQPAKKEKAPNHSMALNKVLILCASNPKNDPRPNRMITLLQDKYQVTVVGATEASIEGIESLGLFEPTKNPGLSIVSIFKTIAYPYLYKFGLINKQIEELVWEKLGRGKKLLEELSKQKFDLIITHDCVLLPFAAEIKRVSNARLLFDAREYYTRDFEDSLTWRLLRKPIFQHLCNTYLKLCDKIITVSEGLAREYAREFKVTPEVIMSLPEPIDLSPGEVDSGKIKIVYHGIANHSRQTAQMIELMDYLDQRFTLDLMLVNQNDNYWRKMASMTQHRKNVRVIPPVAMREIISTTNRYDIGLFLCPPTNFNLKYTLPNKFFEYIQARLAVAIGPSIEMKEIAEKYDCGIVSEDFQPQSLAKKLNALTRDKVNYYKKQAHRAALELNAGINKQRIISIIEKLLQGSLAALRMRKSLVLFTATYPYDGGAEQTFLEGELHHLLESFDRLVLVPRKCIGNRLPLPKNIEVDDSYANQVREANSINTGYIAFKSRDIYNDLIARPSLLRYPSALLRLITFVAGAQLTKAWVDRWLSQNRSMASQIVFYTYWFDQGAMGIGLAKKNWPNIKLVSRVHGYDLYEEYYYRPPYWPCRRTALSLLDALFPDSQAGTDYLIERYPEFSKIISPQLLGTADPGFVTPASGDGVFRIVSCSLLHPVKRMDLLLDGLIFAANLRPNQQFEWRHYGNGDLRLKLQERADRELPSNARAYLPGYTNQKDLYDNYRKNPADVFVNLSITEGTPVTLMEAASCGLPLIATAVGGNKEIVNAKNGKLLTADPAVDDIAAALFQLIDHPTEALKMREESRIIWNQQYRAEANFREFALRLENAGGA